MTVIGAYHDDMQRAHDRIAAAAVNASTSDAQAVDRRAAGLGTVDELDGAFADLVTGP